MRGRRVRLRDAAPRSHYLFWITSRFVPDAGAVVRHRFVCRDNKRRPGDDATSMRAFKLLGYLFGPNEIAQLLRLCRAGIP